MTTEASNPSESRPMSNRDSNRYGAFISYRHTALDRQWAKWLHSKLETYRVPKHLVASGAPGRVGRVFRDEEELSASADLSQRIDEALADTRFLIVVCSPRTPESRWVNEEVKRFQAQGRAERLFALLIEGEPGQSFPPALRDLEPLAADVRPVGGESLADSQEDRAAQTTGRRARGTLRRSATSRRGACARRLRRLAGGAALLALTFLGLSLFAWQQWQRAETELRIARAQNLAAQAQIAYVTIPTTDAFETAVPERGVLLALESLTAYPTVEGDLVLRAGLRKLGGPPLEVPIEEGANLTSVGPQGSWILLQTEGGSRIFDVVENKYRDANPTETLTRTHPSAYASTDSAGGIDQNVRSRSPDGQLYLLDSEEGQGEWAFASAAIHRVSDGKKLALLPHEWPLQFAAFSPDTRWLVTVTGQASTDASDPSATALVGSTVRVWEVPSGRKITEVSLAHDGGIGQAVLSPDGDWLATMSETPSGRVVRLWPLWPELLRTEACKRLTRNLSESEWVTFVRVKPQRETCSNLPIVSE